MLRIKNIIELVEVPLEEFITLSKQDKSPVITITDELSALSFNYVVAVADKLKLVFFIVKGTRKLAFIGNVKVAEKICQILKVKRQCMFFHRKDKRINGYKFPNYVVRAFDEDNNKIDPFINTNIEITSIPILGQYDFKHIRYVMKVRRLL